MQILIFLAFPFLFFAIIFYPKPDLNFSHILFPPPLNFIVLLKMDSSHSFIIFQYFKFL